MKVGQVISREQMEELGEYLDLTPYLSILQQGEVGGGIVIEVEEGENPRALKKRFGTAAKTLGLSTQYKDLPSGGFRIKIREASSSSSEEEDTEEGTRPPMKKRGRPKKGA